MNNENKSLDTYKPESVLQFIDLKTILNADSLKLLPPYTQCHLLQLLPSIELQTTLNGELKYSFDCLKNEYISQAMMEWQDKLSDGIILREILADHQSQDHFSNSNCFEMKHEVDDRNPLKRIYAEANPFCTDSSQTNHQTVMQGNGLNNDITSDNLINIKRRRSCVNSTVAPSLDDKSMMLQFDSKLTKARVVLHRVMLKRYNVYEDNIYSAMK